MRKIYASFLLDVGLQPNTKSLLYFAIPFLVLNIAMFPASALRADPPASNPAPTSMPASFSTPSMQTAVEAVKVTPQPPKQMPHAPEGFQVGVFASNLSRPREMAVAPNGDIFVSQVGEGNVIILRDTDGDGVADKKINFADGFRQPSGLAVRADGLYVADLRAIWRLSYNDGEKNSDKRMMITRPGALGNATSRPVHSIAFTRDGRHFYVSVGTQQDVAEEDQPQASIQKFRADGSSQMSYAAGIRYATSIAFYPDTDDLYAVVNERDNIPGDAVLDYFTRVRKGSFYGWPYAYNGSTPDPQYGELRPDLVKTALTPDVLLPAHSSPTGLLFYQGDAMPKTYLGSAFIVLHGSRDTSKPVGYKVLRIHFKNGRPQPDAENFLSGFTRVERGHTEIWGRPYAIAESTLR